MDDSDNSIYWDIVMTCGASPTIVLRYTTADAVAIPQQPTSLRYHTALVVKRIQPGTFSEGVEAL